MSSGTTNDGLRVNNDLSQLAPLFRKGVEDAIAECRRNGLDAIVYEAYRSQDLQANYFARGRTIRPPLYTVTNAPSNQYSWHGYGLAVDVISRARGWDAGEDWFKRVADIFKKHQCKWGGDWKQKDRPHFQWHLCKASPSDEARRLLNTSGIPAVWEAVGAVSGDGRVAPPAVVAAALPTRTAVVTASELNFRHDPSTDRPEFRKLPRGTVLQVVEPQGSWFKVLVEGVVGYVHGDHIALRDHSFDARFLAADTELQAAPLKPGTFLPVPPQGTAKRVALTWNKYGGLLAPLSKALHIRPSAAVAVLCVESGGAGFVQGRMIIRFETHIFHRLWGKQNQDVFKRHFRFDSSKPWTGQEFSDGAGPFASFHGDQANEWKVFEFACTLNRSAALRAISMGASQIMGFNHGAIGYDSADQMFDAFSSDERYHILGMFDFIKGPGNASEMVKALQQENYEAFATRYNGGGQANEYGGRIRAHAEAFAPLQPA